MTSPPILPVAPVFDPAGLQPGDVLLMLGDGPLSELIAWCGDSIYSHAALVVDGGDLIEAAAKGVRRYPLAQRLADADNYFFVDAFRPLDAAAAALTDADRSAVLAHAQSLLSVPYPLDSLATLGVILAVRGKWPAHWLARIVVREALDHLVRDDPSHMVCSEVVYRSFAEADVQPHGRLAPQIVLQARGTEPFLHIDWKALWDEVWPLLRPGRRQALTALAPHAALAAARGEEDAAAAAAPPAATMIGDAELDAMRARARALLGAGGAVLPDSALDDGALLRQPGETLPPTPLPHPNPKLVTPLDLATTPSHIVLGRVMQAPQRGA